MALEETARAVGQWISAGLLLLAMAIYLGAFYLTFFYNWLESHTK
ncbi:MAG: hypothetical protein AAF197_02315 [Pseudomonadota bacterium]